VCGRTSKFHNIRFGATPTTTTTISAVEIKTVFASAHCQVFDPQHPQRLNVDDDLLWTRIWRSKVFALSVQSLRKSFGLFEKTS